MAGIVSNPEVRNGKPVFEGTRISPLDIIDFWINGLSDREILEEYPSVKKEFLKSTLEFALEMLKEYRNFLIDKSGNRLFRKRLLALNRCIHLLESGELFSKGYECRACLELVKEVLDRKVKIFAENTL